MLYQKIWFLLFISSHSLSTSDLPKVHLKQLKNCSWLLHSGEIMTGSKEWKTVEKKGKITPKFDQLALISANFVSPVRTPLPPMLMACQKLTQ